MQSTLMRLAGPGLPMFIVSATVTANTLSNTYYSAFAEPQSFEFLLFERLTKDADFHKKFDTCWKLAPAALNNLEKQNRASYSACKENSECQQRARDVQTVINVKSKAGDLAVYIKAMRSKNPPDFASSKVGQMAFMQQKGAGVPVNRIPEFKREVAILQVLPCP